jgi:sec-independent protein translocase protein TatB
MFEVGFQEIVMIALLALIVLGPEKLPKLAAKVGHWTGRARIMARNLRMQLEQEVSYEELKQQKDAAEEALRRAQSAPIDFHADNKTEPSIAQPSAAPITGSPPPPQPAPDNTAAADAAPETTQQSTRHS